MSCFAICDFCGNERNSRHFYCWVCKRCVETVWVHTHCHMCGVSTRTPSSTCPYHDFVKLDEEEVTMEIVYQCDVCESVFNEEHEHCENCKILLTNSSSGLCHDCSAKKSGS